MSDKPTGMSQELDNVWTMAAEAVEYEMNKALSRSGEPEGRLYKAMRYATLGGGKRLRPFLVYASSRIFGVDKSSATRVAAAVEFVHAYSLIHDDLPCMDNSHLRRGKPATHVRYGEATALLAGNALLTLAFDILSSTNVHESPRVRLELITSLAKASGGHGMIGGQMLDMISHQAKADMGSLARLQRLKTGELISFSCEAGAILSKASDHARHDLQAYAYDLGLAFQIVDDLLDVYGNEEDTGKPVGQDEEHGRATFVSLMGPERALSQAKILSEQAIDHLKDFGREADLLREVAKFVVERKA